MSTKGPVKMPDIRVGSISTSVKLTDEEVNDLVICYDNLPKNAAGKITSKALWDRFILVRTQKGKPPQGILGENKDLYREWVTKNGDGFLGIVQNASNVTKANNEIMRREKKAPDIRPASPAQPTAPTQPESKIASVPPPKIYTEEEMRNATQDKQAEADKLYKSAPQPLGPIASMPQGSTIKPPEMLGSSPVKKEEKNEIQTKLESIKVEFSNEISQYQKNWETTQAKNKTSWMPTFLQKKQHWKRGDQIMQLNMAFARAIKNSDPKEIVKELEDLKKHLNKESKLLVVCENTINNLTRKFPQEVDLKLHSDKRKRN